MGTLDRDSPVYINMEYISTAITAIGSSLLTLIIKGFIDLYIRNSEYKKDIQKSFIKRRIEAYEQLENVIAPLNLIFEDTDGRRIHFIYVRKTTFEQFSLQLGAALKYNLWYSPEIIDLLGELNSVQLSILEPGYHFEETPEFCDKKIQEAKNMYEFIWKLKSDLTKQIGKDLQTIHEVKFSQLFIKD